MQTNKNIDYSPLIDKVSFLTAYKYLKNTKRLEQTNNIFTLLLLLGVLFGFVIIILDTFGIVKSLEGLGIVVFVFTIISLASLYVFGQNTKTKYSKYKFAEINGFKYNVAIKNPSYNGIFFGLGKARIIEEEYQINTKDGLICIGNYSYSLSDINTYKNAYIKISMGKIMPNIILDSKQNNQFKKISNVKSLLNSSQYYDLEGSFNNHFSAIIPNSYGKDALYILTPNVMSQIVDNAPNYDIELVTEDLFLYKPGAFKLNNPQEIQNCINTALGTKKAFLKQINAYSDERSPLPSDIHASGKKLKDSVSPLIIIATVLTIGILLLIITGNTSFIFMFLAISLLVTGFFINPFKKN